MNVIPFIVVLLKGFSVELICCSADLILKLLKQLNGVLIKKRVHGHIKPIKVI